jgi:hypothetical protein
MARNRKRQSRAKRKRARKKKDRIAQTSEEKQEYFENKIIRQGGLCNPR